MALWLGHLKETQSSPSSARDEILMAKECLLSKLKEQRG